MKFACSIFAAFAVLTTTPASAARIVVRYDGVVTTGSDLSGVFGAPGGALDDHEFRATYVLDDEIGGSAFDPPTGSSFHFLNLGGMTVVDAKVRINGRTFDFWCGGGPDYCDVRHAVTTGVGGDAMSSHIGIFAVDTTVIRLWDQSMSFGIASETPFLPDFDYRSPTTYAVQPGDTVEGRLYIADRVMPSDGPEYFLQKVDARLRPLSVSISVPEPSTWALMIVGFGAAGAALRRRRFSAAPAGPPGRPPAT